jgi:hypothetical protein
MGLDNLISLLIKQYCYCCLFADITAACLLLQLDALLLQVDLPPSPCGNRVAIICSYTSRLPYYIPMQAAPLRLPHQVGATVWAEQAALCQYVAKQYGSISSSSSV